MIRLVLLTLCLCILSLNTHADLVWHWQDRFSPTEQQKLTAWVTQTAGGVEDTVGAFPFDVHIHFHRQDNANEPVPWAHTERDERQGVHFYVDTRYKLEAFLSDWTAPHELSHLILPYLGAKNAWFAEGFASYMQYQVMQTMGVLDEQQARTKYRENMDRAQQGYAFNEMPFTLAAPHLMAKRKYPTLYWGGAVYFMQVDHSLRQQNSSLIELLSEYLRCCRMQNHSFKATINNLDRLTKTHIFTSTLTSFQRQPGFPVYWPVLNT